MHVVGCICDDDAANLAEWTGLCCGCLDPGPLGPEHWRCRRWRRTCAAFCCAALMGSGGLVLLFWKLTFSLPLPRSRAGAGSALSSAVFGGDAQGDGLSRTDPVCHVHVCVRGLRMDGYVAVCAPSQRQPHCSSILDKLVPRPTEPTVESATAG